jgi:hypothetical protein
MGLASSRPSTTWWLDIRLRTCTFTFYFFLRVSAANFSSLFSLRFFHSLFHLPSPTCYLSFTPNFLHHFTQQ